MDWYLIVLITYIVICLISIILLQINEEYVLYWACGIPSLIIFVLLYPVRAWVEWDRSKGYYQKHGISRWQYIFGKRVKD